ncbi:MAG: hypothetical protein PHX80_03665 [Candidatus Nanoarchaeia archaeon]|nr:hypothetical protein [Candidatus Nanoarchaeia archaeon]
MKIKSFLILVGLLFAMMLTISAETCDTSSAPSARDVAIKAQDESSQRAIEAVPIPSVSYFQEKRTIAKWAERWDKPNLPCYVYLISYGNILGYYVTDGKPASTKSYLMPEERIVDDPYGSVDAGGQIVSTPDIDGTYGDNNPGIRFFTAEGTAVEWGGQGACYIYSDAPLPIKVPKLNIIIENK